MKKYEFEIGVNDQVSGDDGYSLSGINVEQDGEDDFQFNRIEVYGKNAMEARMLRDFVLSSLKGSAGSLVEAYKAYKQGRVDALKEMQDIINES